MKYQERADIILETLQKQQTVKAEELSSILRTSLVTIRKDLQKLENEGKLIRIFGGATSCMVNNEEQRRMIAMQKVAGRAVQEIQDGDCVILNAGTTNLLTVKNLSNFQSLTIITNALAIARDLSQRKEIQLIFLGGEMSSDAVYTRGSEAIEQLGQYKANKVILSVSGISCSRGITTRHMEMADLFCKMMERAEEVIVVADDTKIGFESFYHVCGVDVVHKLITNYSAKNEEELQQMERMGIEVCRC